MVYFLTILGTVLIRRFCYEPPQRRWRDYVIPGIIALVVVALLKYLMQ